MRMVNIPWLVLSIIIAVVVKLMIIIHITITSHGRHVVSNHRSFDCLFNSEYVPTSKKHQSPHYRSFVREIHRKTVEFFATQMPSNAEKASVWCGHKTLQSPSHYPSQLWPRSMSPFGVTRPQWANWITGMHLVSAVNRARIHLGLTISGGCE